MQKIQEFPVFNENPRGYGFSFGKKKAKLLLSEEQVLGITGGDTNWKFIVSPVGLAELKWDWGFSVLFPYDVWNKSRILIPKREWRWIE